MTTEDLVTYLRDQEDHWAQPVPPAPTRLIGQTADAVRTAVATLLADEYWTEDDTCNVIVWSDGTWCSPGMASTYGTWQVSPEGVGQPPVLQFTGED